MLSSLRLRLLVGMTGSISILLILFGVVIYATLRQSLLDEFDFALEKVARTMAAAALVERGVIEVELAPEMIPDFQQDRGTLYYQYWVEDGTNLGRSATLGDANLPTFHGPTEAPVLKSISLPNGHPARAAGMRFRPAIEYVRERPEGAIQTDQFPAVTIVVARDVGQLQRRLSQLLWLLIAAGAGTTVVGLLVSGIVVARGLRPLRRLAQEIAAIGEEELTVRLGVAHLPDEILPVVERINELLSRLQAAFARERSFTSDVAHELRTPLAGIRSTLEVALARQRPTAEYQEALADVLEIGKRLQTMVENLLMLARWDAGHGNPRRESIPLAELVQTCWEPLAPIATDRRLSFDNRIAPDCIGWSDRHCLETVFGNLLQNAAEYTDEGGRAWVEATVCEQDLEIKIANTGCTLTPDQVEQACERFWRADSARRDTGLHCGLGLAIVRRIVLALGGTVDTRREPDDVFAVTLTLPLATPE